MSVNKLTYLSHLRVFLSFLRTIRMFRLSGKIYFPSNPGNRESTVLGLNLYIYIVHEI
jgi:hypothetical protein